MNLPKICQRKFSCVNDVSMVIDVSIATVYSEVYFDYFLSFFSLSSVFFPFVCGSVMEQSCLLHVFDKDTLKISSLGVQLRVSIVILVDVVNSKRFIHSVKHAR